MAKNGADTARPEDRPVSPPDASEARLRAIVDNAVEGIITIDELGIVNDVNPAVSRLFGYTPEELIGQNVKILMPDAYGREHDGYLRNYRLTGRRKIIGIGREVAGRRKDGSEFPIELSVSEVPLGDRRLFTGIVRDITERKRVEAERQRFVSLVENSSDFIATASLTWEVLYINRAGQALIGVTPDRVTGLEVRDLWDDSTLPVVIGEALPAQQRGESMRFQGRVRHFVTGELIEVDCNAFAILDAETRAPATIAFSIRDIREQKQAEQALRDSEARITGILDSAVDGIVTIDERGSIESLNPAAQRIFGYTPAELIGRNVNVLMPEPYHREHDQYLRNYRHTGRRKIIGIGREVVGRRKDGTTFPLDLSVSEVNLGDRRLFTGIIRDITERKEAERHRNLLVAELSHRVKNILATVVSVSRQTFKRGQTDLEQARDAFEGRLLALSKAHTRLGESDWKGANLEDVLRDEIAPYQDSDEGRIRLAGPPVELGPRLAVALGMAFHELATNAAKHGALSGAGGAVEVNWELALRGEETLLRLEWRERGVAGLKPPKRSGFGRFLLERGLAHDLKGKVQLDFAEGGLRCTILCPL
jgi:PAS domain S-box-containing protein